MQKTVVIVGQSARVALGRSALLASPPISPSSFSSSSRRLAQAYPSTSYCPKAIGQSLSFSTSSIAHGKSRPGEGKDARRRARVLARKGGNRDMQEDSTSLEEAVRILKAVEVAKPASAYELHVVTSVDSHQSNSLRGRLALPRDARTKSEKLLIFAESGSPAAQAALEAKQSASNPDDIIIGGSEMISDVVTNRVSGFTKVLATPGLLPQISKELARSLGPRGLMPSAKRGTVIAGEREMKDAIVDAKGAMDWRGDRQGVVRGAVGRIHFPTEDVQQNVIAFLLAIVDKVSSGAGTTSNIFSGSKAVAEMKEGQSRAALTRRVGQVIKRVHLSSTRGPGILLDTRTLI